MSSRFLLALALILLGGCNRETAAPTAEENSQLDDAANMLNEAPANLEEVDDMGLQESNALESGPR